MMKKTGATPQSILSDQLALCTEALRDCFDGARAARAGNDQYGHRKSGELTAAVAILKASAKLGTALAKINGEFHHNIRVEKQEGVSKSKGSNGRGP